jgi:hypothetical protein
MAEQNINNVSGSVPKTPSFNSGNGHEHECKCVYCDLKRAIFEAQIEAQIQKGNNSPQPSPCGKCPGCLFKKAAQEQRERQQEQEKCAKKGKAGDILKCRCPNCLAQIFMVHMQDDKFFAFVEGVE